MKTVRKKTLLVAMAAMVLAVHLGASVCAASQCPMMKEKKASCCPQTTAVTKISSTSSCCSLAPASNESSAMLNKSTSTPSFREGFAFHPPINPLLTVSFTETIVDLTVGPPVASVSSHTVLRI